MRWIQTGKSKYIEPATDILHSGATEDAKEDYICEDAYDKGLKHKGGKGKQYMFAGGGKKSFAFPTLLLEYQVLRTDR
jgi:hypothetical protein